MIKADSTLRTSQAVPHPSTNRALCRLTSEVGRDPVHSTRYGRQRKSRNVCELENLFMPEGYGATVPVGRGTVPEGRAQHGPRSKNLTPLDPPPRAPTASQPKPRAKQHYIKKNVYTSRFVRLHCIVQHGARGAPPSRREPNPPLTTTSRAYRIAAQAQGQAAIY